MGLILDVVPNHMAADDANAFWADPELRRRFFDLDETTGRWRRFFDVDELAGVRQEDPEVFERPWTFSMPFVKSDDYTIYEYACHEGNEATGLMLRGARTLEREAASGSK